MKELLYICLKNPLTERDMVRMGIEVLEKKFDVHILDCTAWLMPEALATRVKTSLSRNNLYRVNSLREFKAKIVNERKGYAIDYIGQFSIQAVLLFNELKKNGFKLIVLDSGATPTSELKVSFRTIIERLVRVFRFTVLRQHINARMINLLLKILPDQKPDYALVAGDAWKKNQRFISAHMKIPAHSFDYETYLQVKKEKPRWDFDYAVYLDENITGHEDNYEIGLNHPATSKHYYPAFNKFMEEFEKTSGLKVMIAAYPSCIRSECEKRFNGRQVFFGETASLIRNAKLVFAHGTTSISFAVLWRRPLVFLTSNEIERSWYQPSIEIRRKILSATIVNIDNNDSVIDMKKWVNLKDGLYKRYEETYLRSKESSELSLWDIFSNIKSNFVKSQQLFN
jgi:hypothetical protein